MCRTAAILFCLLLVPVSARADGPRDNQPENIRPIPPPGIEVPQADAQQLRRGLDELASALKRLGGRRDTAVQELLPDVEIFARAVRDALDFHEFFAKGDVDRAKALIKLGLERAADLEKGAATWPDARGLTVRGYRSRIDGSVQPYGLVVPKSYSAHAAGRYRLDIWFHGRGETLSEVNFLDQRLKQAGQFAPADTIVLHPYGRYSNAFKFAGEVDVLEALADVQRRYRIDPDRIAVRGFSMGGAACWQFAVHFADRWVAANPGAGFAETALFLKNFQGETVQPTWYERLLWRWYDCPGYAGNLAQCPTVAYSGEIDPQKQAADVMQQALKAEGLTLKHVIGPETKHKYHPQSAIEVEGLMASIAQRGRTQIPPEIDFTTYTLVYNRYAWLELTGLGEHWQRARVRAALKPQRVALATENVTDLKLNFPAGWAPFDLRRPVKIEIDDAELLAPPPSTDHAWSCSLYRERGQWRVGSRPYDGLHKGPGLPGPIDHAFMDSFLIVKPSGTCRSAKIDGWVKAEMQHAIEHWRRHFRGHARVKLDTEVTDADIAAHHLVVWGDPQANRLLARIADKLPLRWEGQDLLAAGKHYAADHHAAVLVYPNPLNPQRYVVVNSGFTFREFDYLNNARQVPKLPDWAVIDVSTPPDGRFPGKVAAADFFNESWEFKKPSAATAAKP
jgi:acetyl esterase/lipase